MSRRGYIPLSSRHTSSHGSSRPSSPHAHEYETSRSTLIDFASGLARRPRSLLSVLLACLMLLLFLVNALGGFEAGPMGSVSRESGSWEELFHSSQGGWKPPGKMKSSVSPQRDKFLTGECLTAWVAEGVVCPSAVAESVDNAFDVVLPWTNGTDRLLSRWRKELLREGGKMARRAVGQYPPVRGPKASEITARHFREHDELRHALRSLLASFTPASIREITIVSADIPVQILPSSNAKTDSHTVLFSSNTSVDCVMVGQSPTWLIDGSLESTAQPPLRLVHHSDIFGKATPEDTKAWIGSAFPSFNSLAIEAQLPHITGLGQHVLYTNDDVFFMKSMSSSDVANTLTGPVFRVQRDLLVNSAAPGKGLADADGEWPSLRHANYLLDQRFGERNRGYLGHIAKTLPVSIWREARTLWDDELTETSASRFRGAKPEVQTSFLVTHYAIERHREALLWSFIVARSDTNHDGQLDLKERSAMLYELGFNSAGTTLSSFNVSYPLRSTLDELPNLLRGAGIPLAKATSTVFSSQDGFAMFGAYAPNSPLATRETWPVKRTTSESEYACTLALACFDQEPTTSVEALLREVAFEKPSCGDCLILHLIHLSGPRGVSAFLPPSPAITNRVYIDDDDAAASDAFIPLGGSAKSFRTASFLPHPKSPSLRSRAAGLIHRYRYTMGSTPTQFISMRQAPLVVTALAALSDHFAHLYHTTAHDRLEGREPPAIVTLNDDIQTEWSSGLIDEILAKFYAAEWPNPSPYEKEYAR